MDLSSVDILGSIIRVTNYEVQIHLDIATFQCIALERFRSRAC
jgi:hypothetical protein